jgi:thioredoxin 1
MELQTRLRHIRSESAFRQILEEHANVIICCGRMGPMCVPVYGAMEILREKYPHVLFCDIPFDHPDAHLIRNLPECRGFMGLPFTVYYRDGAPVKATTSIQNQEQIESILNFYY